MNFFFSYSPLIKGFTEGYGLQGCGSCRHQMFLSQKDKFTSDELLASVSTNYAIRYRLKNP